MVCAPQCHEQSTLDPLADARDNPARDRDGLSEAMTRRCHRRSGVTSLLLVVRRSLAHRASNCEAVLGGVNALRCASTVRSARPAGVDPACAPHEPATARWTTPIAVDSGHGQAYFQIVS